VSLLNRIKHAAPHEVADIVDAYAGVLEDLGKNSPASVWPESRLLHAKWQIKYSLEQLLGTVALSGQMTAQLQSHLEAAYLSLASFVPEEDAQAVAGYEVWVHLAGLPATGNALEDRTLDGLFAGDTERVNAVYRRVQKDAESLNDELKALYRKLGSGSIFCTRNVHG